MRLTRTLLVIGAGAALAGHRGPRAASVGAVAGAGLLAASEAVARARQRPGEIPPLWQRIATSAALVAPLGWAAGRARSFGFEKLARFNAASWERMVASAAKDEKPAVLKMVAEACDALRCWMDVGIEKAMTKFNRRPPSAEEGKPPAGPPKL